MTSFPGPPLPSNPTRRQRQAHDEALQKWVVREQARIRRQRALFATIPENIRERLQRVMLDRAEDLLDAGEAEAADALLEFVAEEQAVALVNLFFNDG